jgi:DNA invertase Pin-like site-specific DNA recombinase
VGWAASEFLNLAETSSKCDVAKLGRFDTVKHMNKKQTRAIGYLRVSTQEQANGFGLDAQEAAIRAYCKANDVRLVAMTRDEGQSGSNGLDTRVGLADALLRLQQKEAEMLLVYRLDRLARDYVLQETLVERLRAQDTPVVSATEFDIDTDTDDPTKVLTRQILGSISQYERALIRQRMKAGKDIKRERGGYVGGAPRLGVVAAGGELRPDQEEAETVTRIRELDEQEMSLREIADILNAEGRKTKRGGKWWPSTIARTLRPEDRKTYKG